MALQEIKEHLDIILEITQEKLSEGELLTISHSLKEIYDTTSKKMKNDNGTIHNSHFCPQRFVTVRDQRINNISYRLTIDEQRQILYKRLENYFAEMRRSVTEEIEVLNRTLKITSDDKKQTYTDMKRMISLKGTGHLVGSFVGNFGEEEQYENVILQETNRLKRAWKDHVLVERAIKHQLYDSKEELREMRELEIQRKESMELIDDE